MTRDAQVQMRASATASFDSKARKKTLGLKTVLISALLGLLTDTQAAKSTHS